MDKRESRPAFSFMKGSYLEKVLKIMKVKETWLLFN
jgi:hypothetical protein